MTGVPESDSKSGVARIAEHAPNIFERLRKRGIEYEQVRQVVQSEVPQFPFFFARQFGDRTFKDVLEYIHDWKDRHWKDRLKDDFLLTEDQKAKVAQMDSANGKSRLGSNPGRE